MKFITSRNKSQKRLASFALKPDWRLERNRVVLPNKQPCRTETSTKLVAPRLTQAKKVLPVVRHRAPWQPWCKQYHLEY